MRHTEIEIWRQADEIFNQLIDLTPHARRQLLAELSPAESVLLRVERLLAAHAKGGGPLDQPLLTGSPVAENALRGRQLESWTLDSELGRGGSAVVYRAVREQGGKRQQAAIKILTLAAQGAYGRQRFLREAAILAQLNHPHITPLIDSGTGEDGSCWIAMPLVDGQRIDAWCEGRQLDTRAVVRLFLHVCDAVAYAHSALVVHRDLKPSNVLVDQGGHVRLLDFGIGRFTDDGEEQTHLLWRALTPEYAAPEQLSGAPPSTTMDVYGLGALLYRLLTGQPVRNIASGDSLQAPPRPSSLARAGGPEGRRHYPALRDDLDRVLKKALALDPAQRYFSVEALAEDLRRWLAGQPVLAQPPRLAYRLKKFALRNKAGIAAAAALLLALTAGIGGTLWQAQRAEAQAQRAILVRDFLEKVLLSSEPSAGEVPSALDLLNEGARRVREEIAATDPLAAADILTLTGGARNALNDLDRAESDLQLALELLQGRGATAVRELSKIHWELGRLYQVRGPIDKAAEHYRQVVRLNEQWDAPAKDKIIAENSLTSMLLREGDIAGAEALIERVKREISETGLENSQIHLDALNRQSLLIQVAKRDRKLQLPIHEQRIRIVRALYGEDSGWYAYTLADAVPAHRRLGMLDRAGELAEEAVSIVRRIYRKPHMFQAVALCNSAALLLQRGQIEDALRRYDESIAVDFAIDRNDLHAESCVRGRAYARAALQRFPEALADLEASRAMLIRNSRENSAQWLGNCGADASVLMRMGRVDAAAERLNRCRQAAPELSAHPPIEIQLAQAELDFYRGRLAESARLLAGLRASNPPDTRFRQWLRPWMLSLWVARQSGGVDQESGIRSALAQYPGSEAQSPCFAIPTEEACLAIL